MNGDEKVVYAVGTGIGRKKGRDVTLQRILKFPRKKKLILPLLLFAMKPNKYLSHMRYFFFLNEITAIKNKKSVSVLKKNFSSDFFFFFAAVVGNFFFFWLVYIEVRLIS